MPVALCLLMAIKTPLLSLPLLLLFACAGDPNGDPDGTGDPSGGGDDIGTSTKVDGTYEVTSSFDLTTSEALPGIVSEIVQPLTNFSDNPTGTIIDLIAAGDTPASDLIDKIPATLRSILETTMNNLIEDQVYGGVPVLELVADYADLIATIVTDFDVITTMQVGTVDSAGNGNSSHALAGFAFDMDGTRMVIDTPELLDTLTTARDVAVNVSLSGSSGTIDIGDHNLSLPIGDFAVYGLDAAIQANTEFDDLGDMLSGMVGCTAIAANIGDLCLGFVCVVSESQLAGLCETGLDLVADQIESRLAAIGTAEIRLVGGQASVALGAKSDSTSGDAVTAMEAGSWDTEFALDARSFPVQAGFEARRVD